MGDNWEKVSSTSSSSSASKRSGTSGGRNAAAAPASPSMQKGKSLGTASPYSVLPEVNMRGDNPPPTSPPKSSKKKNLTAPKTPDQKKDQIVPPSVTASVAAVSPAKIKKEQAPSTPPPVLTLFLDNLTTKNLKGAATLRELADYLEQRIQSLDIFTMPYASPKYKQPHLDWEERTDIPYGLYRTVTKNFKSVIVKFLKTLDTTTIADGLVALVRSFVEGQKKAITLSSTHCRQSIAHEILIQIVSVNYPRAFFVENTSRGVTPAHEVLGHYPAVGHALLWVCGQQTLSALNPHLIGFEYWVEYFAPIFWNGDDNASGTVQAAAIDYLEAILSSMEATQTKRVLVECEIPTISLENYLRFVDIAVSPSSSIIKKKKKGDVVHARLQRVYVIIRAMAFSVNRVEVLKFKQPVTDVFGHFLQAWRKAPDAETKAEIEGICTMILARDVSSKNPELPNYWLSVLETYPKESLSIFRRILSLSAKKGKIWTLILRSKEFRKMLVTFSNALSSQKKTEEVTGLLQALGTLRAYGQQYSKPRSDGFCNVVDIYLLNTNFIVDLVTTYVKETSVAIFDHFYMIAVTVEPVWKWIGPFLTPGLGPAIAVGQSIYYSENAGWGYQMATLGWEQFKVYWHAAAEYAVFVLVPLVFQFIALSRSWVEEKVAPLLKNVKTSS
ncbi:hypothetical protein BC829DRAFT_378289 [Chytridium lagenaria]|nr:hypothetical protein BC829DRAFT_378289 [Chytridium lagenaria]